MSTSLTPVTIVSKSSASGRTEQANTRGRRLSFGQRLSLSVVRRFGYHEVKTDLQKIALREVQTCERLL